MTTPSNQPGGGPGAPYMPKKGGAKFKGPPSKMKKGKKK